MASYETFQIFQARHPEPLAALSICRRFLRHSGSQRKRGESARRVDAEDDRTRTRRGRAEDRHHRLYYLRERPGTATCIFRILRSYGHPPDKQERTTQIVLEQAEVPSEAWAA